MQSLSVLIRLEQDASMCESAGGCMAHVDECAQLLPLLGAEVHEVFRAPR